MMIRSRPRPALNAVLLCILFFALSAPPDAASEEKQAGPIRFIHESADTPEIARLRAEFDFDEYAARGETELDQMLLLKNWVFENVDFKHNYGLGNLRNALRILRLARGGATFHCSHFAAVYMQCAVSMGWTARYFFLRNVKEEEHAVNEVWSNQLSKWIFVDVTWNVHIEKDSVPLSILEIRNEWIRNGGRDVVYVFGAGANEARYTHEDLPVERSDNNAWIWWPLDDIFITYTWEVALIGRNDFFTGRVGEGDGFWDLIYVIKDSLNSWDEGWSLHRRTDVDDMRALYHDINRVDVRTEPAGGRSLRVRLDAFGPYNYTPNFREFEARINGGAWRAVGPDFRWDLGRGPNVLEARVVNRFGVTRPVTRIVRRR